VGSRDLFKLWKIADNMLEWYKIATQLPWKTNRKSYVAYQMASTAMTLSDLESHSPIYCKSSNGTFHTAVQQLTRPTVSSPMAMTSRKFMKFTHNCLTNPAEIQTN